MEYLSQALKALNDLESLNLNLKSNYLGKGNEFFLILEECFSQMSSLNHLKLNLSNC